MTSTSCACKCNCYRSREPHCDNLCQRCWGEWCQASEKHAPAADSSYMGTFGIGNIWTGWLISQKPELVAEGADVLQRYETPPRCPDPRGEHPGSNSPMSRRPGCWKCYRLEHGEEPVVVMEEVRLPRSPRLAVIGLEKRREDDGSQM